MSNCASRSESPASTSSDVPIIMTRSKTIRDPAQLKANKPPAPTQSDRDEAVSMLAANHEKTQKQYTIVHDANVDIASKIEEVSQHGKKTIMLSDAPIKEIDRLDLYRRITDMQKRARQLLDDCSDALVIQQELYQEYFKLYNTAQMLENVQGPELCNDIVKLIRSIGDLVLPAVLAGKRPLHMRIQGSKAKRPTKKKPTVGKANKVKSAAKAKKAKSDDDKWGNDDGLAELAERIVNMEDNGDKAQAAKYYNKIRRVIQKD
jgi:hypothetical protein